MTFKMQCLKKWFSIKVNYVKYNSVSIRIKFK